MKITVEYVRKDGSITDTLTPEEQARFEQKLIDAAAPIAHEAMMRELSEKEQSNAHNAQ